MQLGRVFISSVFGGMLDLRQAAAEAARLVGLEPVETERHIAQPGSVRDALAREIAACDTYVGFFDRRRGTVPKGSAEDRPRAITEEEFALARELGLRCLVFLSRAAAADREPGLNDFLETDVTDYGSGLWTRFYEDEAALRREIAAGLAALRPRVILSLSPEAGGLAARLFLRDVAPAWTKEPVLGPVRCASISARPPGRSSPRSAAGPNPGTG